LAIIIPLDEFDAGSFKGRRPDNLDSLSVQRPVVCRFNGLAACQLEVVVALQIQLEFLTIVDRGIKAPI
jgi:hypothetical protein